MNNWKTHWSEIFCLVTFVVMVAVGAQLRIPFTPYVLIGFTIFVILSVYLNKIQPSMYPYYIFFLSLGLMWQASMFGAHVIGSDMHGEYFVSRTVLAEGSWDIAKHYGTQSSTSIVVGFLVPYLSRVFHIDIVWIYKAFLPFLFSLTPVVLYYIYKQAIGEKLGFYAAMFFMIVPVTTLEIVQIGKSMVAELFMALALMAVLVRNKNKPNTLSLIVVITAFSLTAMLAHYTVGMALLAYLFGIFLVRLATNWIPRWQLVIKKALPLVVLPVVLAVVGSASYAYYNYADEGVIVKVMARVVPVYSRIISNTASEVTGGLNVLTPTNPAGPGATNPAGPGATGSIFYRQEVLIRTSIGMDFPEATIPGKAFRITQYLTQLLIVAGGVALFFIHRRYKFTAEFVAAIWASYLLLAMCVFIPEFSNIINATRFYHIAIFFLAPMFVLGAMVLFRKELILVLVLIIYFIFTSGLVFEITKSERISQIDTPYSVGLSAERTGVVATYAKSDVVAIEWLERNIQGDTMVVGDYNGWHLVSAYLGMKRLRADQARYNPTFDNLPDKPAFIFVTDWNSRHGQYIDSLRGVRGGAGLRASYPLPEFDYPVVFQSGNSIIYKKGE